MSEQPVLSDVVQRALDALSLYVKAGDEYTEAKSAATRMLYDRFRAFAEEVKPLANVAANPAFQEPAIAQTFLSMWRNAKE